MSKLSGVLRGSVVKCRSSGLQAQGTSRYKTTTTTTTTTTAIIITSNNDNNNDNNQIRRLKVSGIRLQADLHANYTPVFLPVELYGQ